MPTKTIIQQPVAIDHVKQVVFIIFGTSVDAVTNYQPVDATGATIGEVRSYTENFRGQDATRVKNFLTTEIVPDLNVLEGTA